jgi:hypothetical protein
MTPYRISRVFTFGGFVVCAGWLASVATVGTQESTFVQVSSTPVVAEMLEVQGGRAYTILGRLLTVFDVSDPASPKRGGTHTFDDKVWGFTVVGTTLFVAVDKSGLVIMDVSTISAPKLQGSVKTPGQAKSVAIVGTRALVSDHMSGVNFVDISNLAKPALAGSYFLEGYSRAVSAVGSIVTAVDSPNGVYVFDLSKPGAADPVGSLQNAERPNTVEMSEGAGGRPDLAVLTGSGMVQIYDVSNPAAPAKASTFRAPGVAAQRVALRGRRAYVAGGAGGLQVLDLSTPSKPRVVGEFKAARPVRDVAVSGSHVYIVTGRPVPPESTVEPTDGEFVILREAK